MWQSTVQNSTANCVFYFHRLKDQEALWRSQQDNGVLGFDDDLRQRELKELMQIENLMKENAKKQDDRIISRNSVQEEVMPVMQGMQQTGIYCLLYDASLVEIRCSCVPFPLECPRWTNYQTDYV